MKYALTFILGFFLVVFALVLFHKPKPPVISQAIPIAWCDDGQIKTVQHEDGRLEHFECPTIPVKEWPCDLAKQKCP